MKVALAGMAYTFAVALLSPLGASDEPVWFRLAVVVSGVAGHGTIFFIELVRMRRRQEAARIEQCRNARACEIIIAVQWARSERER